MENAIGTSGACLVLGKSRSTLHRQRCPKPPGPPAERKEFHHPAELAAEEKRAVLQTLDSPRFAGNRSRRPTRSCWMRAATCARRPACTGFCASAALLVTAARTPRTRRGRNRSCSPPGRTRCGHGISSATRRRVTERRWKTFASGLSQQPGEAGGSLTREVPGRAASSPDNDGTSRHYRMGRVRQARQEGGREEPASTLLKRYRQLKPGGYGLDGGAHPLLITGGELPGRLMSPAGRPR